MTFEEAKAAILRWEADREAIRSPLEKQVWWLSHDSLPREPFHEAQRRLNTTLAEFDARRNADRGFKEAELMLDVAFHSEMVRRIEAKLRALREGTE